MVLVLVLVAKDVCCTHNEPILQCGAFSLFWSDGNKSLCFNLSRVVVDDRMVSYVPIFT